MAESFLSTRGCVYKYTAAGAGSGAGLFDLNPGFPSGNASSPILLTGVDITDQDIIFPVVTVENFKVIYRFGTDYGSVRITGVCLLGAVGTKGGGSSFSSAKAYFDRNRVSNRKTPIQVSVPGTNAYNVYLIGLNIGEPDPAFNIVPFAYLGTIANQQ